MKRFRFRAVTALAGVFLITWPGALLALDVVAFDLYRGEFFTQTGSNSPALLPNNPYFFQVVAEPILALLVTNPTVTLPNLDVLPLQATAHTNGNTFSTNFTFTGTAASSNALLAAYGNGTYSLAYTGHDDGAVTDVLWFANGGFAETPIVSNLLAAQSIDAESNFTLGFLARPSGNSNQFVQLLVMDRGGKTVFYTPAPDAYPEQALLGTNSEINIPAGTLLPGETYAGTLIFSRMTSNTLYRFTGFPVLQTGFVSENTFSLQTQGGSNMSTPPPTLAPASLSGLDLTFDATNGGGSFASSAIYQIFASAVGASYNVLGAPGGNFAGGGYTYASTGSNTATVTFADAQAGSTLLQLTFRGAGAGSFVLSNAAGAQSGTFVAAPAVSAVMAPSLYLPSASNGLFQAWLGGQPGAGYEIETSTNLTAWSAWTNVTLSDLSTNISDSLGGHRYYRVAGGAASFAPNAVAGQSFNFSATAANSPFIANAAFQWVADTNGDGYRILGVSGQTNSAGIYTYQVTASSAAMLDYTDSASGVASSSQLVFTSPTGGFFYTSEAGSAAGFQSGKFTMTRGPVLFPGNVGFTPDLNRGASTNFPADGTPVSLSVTDAAGNVWTLSLPADALLTPATITMTPFAQIDSSQLALPIFSGVQLGPDGMQFCDAVTLTLTTPGPLGPHATLLMGAGDGSGMALAQTTNEGGSYSTTLFHFSTCGASDPNDAATQAYLDKALPQAEAAYGAALSQVKALQRVVVQPPEPPDYMYNCSGGNPEGDAAVNAYVQELFAKETAATSDLLGAARTLLLLGQSQSYESDAIAAVRQLVETTEFRKINSLLADYSGNALKFAAVAKAALSVSRQDQLLGGPGLPDLFDQLRQWLSKSVLDYYWKKLLNEHDYTMGQILLQIERSIALLGGPTQPENFIQQVAGGYAFNVTMTITDIGDQLSIKAHGTVAIAGNKYVLFPIGGLTNNFAYDSGSYAGCTLTPTEFEQGAYFNLDCTNETVDLFIYQEMGAYTEDWSCPDGGGPQQLLVQAFNSAFYDAHNTSNINVDYNCEYVFTVPWQNLQAEPVNATFTGPGEFELNELVTFTIVIDHAPQNAPDKLTP